MYCKRLPYAAHREVHRREAVPVQTLARALAVRAIPPARRPHHRVIPTAVKRTGVAVQEVPQQAKIVLVRPVEQLNHHEPIVRLVRNLNANVLKEIAIAYSAAELDPEIVLVEPQTIGPVSEVAPTQTT